MAGSSANVNDFLLGRDNGEGQQSILSHPGVRRARQDLSKDALFNCVEAFLPELVAQAQDFFPLGCRESHPSEIGNFARLIRIAHRVHFCKIRPTIRHSHRRSIRFATAVGPFSIASMSPRTRAPRYSPRRTFHNFIGSARATRQWR
jgi:hypothetical protein